MKAIFQFSIGYVQCAEAYRAWNEVGMFYKHNTPYIILLAIVFYCREEINYQADYFYQTISIQNIYLVQVVGGFRSHIRKT